MYHESVRTIRNDQELKKPLIYHENCSVSQKAFFISLAKAFEKIFVFCKNKQRFKMKFYEKLQCQYLKLNISMFQ